MGDVDLDSVIEINGSEIDYVKASFTKTNDQIVNEGELTVTGAPGVQKRDTIEVYDEDGSDLQIEGQIKKRSQDILTKCPFFGVGFELHNKKKEEVYVNEAPEDIIADAVNSTKKLTYTGTASSGVTIDGSYIANDFYLIDIIKDMLDILRWQLVIDPNGDTRATPRSFINNGRTFTQYTSQAPDRNAIEISDWVEDDTERVTDLTVRGGFRSFNKEETISGTQTTFDLSKRPNGNVRVTVGGSEVDPSNYTVNAQSREIVFDSQQTDPTFQYEYDRPIIVKQQVSGVPEEERVEKNATAPWLDTPDTARKYTRKLLEELSDGTTTIKGTIPGLQWRLQVGELITVVDERRNRSADVVISKIKYDIGNQETTIEAGSRRTRFKDWQANIERRIADLEREQTNEDIVTFSRFIQDTVDVEVTSSISVEKRSPQDTFYLNHSTLNRLKDSSKVASGEPEDYEADCSDNKRYGEHVRDTGVGVSGQFTTDGDLLQAVYLSDVTEIRWED
jgi:hypothetical protein